MFSLSLKIMSIFFFFLLGCFDNLFYIFTRIHLDNVDKVYSVCVVMKFVIFVGNFCNGEYPGIKVEKVGQILGGEVIQVSGDPASDLYFFLLVTAFTVQEYC